jgi:ribonuclease E
VVLPPEIAFYLFNHKRERLTLIESRYNMRVLFTPDGAMAGTNFRIERLRAQTAPPPAPAPVRPERQLAAPVVEEVEESDEAEAETADTNEGGTAEEKAERKRRRRRRGKRREDRPAQDATETTEGESQPEPIPGLGDQPSLEQPSEMDLILEAALGAPSDGPEPVLTEQPAEEAAPKRRRPRTRRRRGEPAEGEAPAEAAPAPAPIYTDIADIFEAAERAEEAARAARRAEAAAVTVVETPAEPAHAVTEAPVQEAPAPEAPEAEAAPKPEPLVKPIVIGEGDASAEKKRGWWRR